MNTGINTFLENLSLTTKIFMKVETILKMYKEMVLTRAVKLYFISLKCISAE